jgi:general secretion pathway protein K
MYTTNDDRLWHAKLSVRPARQRGIAIVTVLLVVALAATLAASVVWRERVAIRDVENQRLAVETMWVERAAVQWARAALRQQSLTSNIAYVGQTWSGPIKDTQLADFLPRDSVAVNGDLANAYISGQVEDAQAKFNLMDLVSQPGPNAPWQIDGNGLLAFRQLLSALSLSPALAQVTADYMLRSLKDGRGSDSWPMQLVSIEDLIRVPGYDAQAVRDLSSVVTILPDYTLVNANTASESVLAAVIPALSTAQAHALAERRNTAYFNSTGEIALVLSPQLASSPDLPTGALVTVNSGYFIVHCRIHSTKINTRIDTLIGRYGIGRSTQTSVVWVHRSAS